METKYYLILYGLNNSKFFVIASSMEGAIEIFGESYKTESITRIYECNEIYQRPLQTN